MAKKLSKVKSTKKKTKTMKIPNVGSTAPDFNLPDPELNMKSLVDYKDKKVVLAFFPASMSPVCTKEMCTFRDSFQELNDVGAQVVAVSIDGPFANKQFTAMYNLNFPVLSNYNYTIRTGLSFRDLSEKESMEVIGSLVPSCHQ